MTNFTVICLLIEQIPRLLYCTQSFKSWVTWFLSRPAIENALEKTFLQPAPTQFNAMRSIQDSPAWQALRGFLRTPYDLVFAIYIDWLNPFTNKQAGILSCILFAYPTDSKPGKKYSMGAVVAYCMNLPIEIAFAPENCFFITATPGPKEPDVVTLNHCIRPFIDEVMPFQRPGKQIPTYRHPDGALVRTRVGIPVIADTPALHKVNFPS